MTGVVDTRRLEQRYALRPARGCEVHESRQSLGQSRRRRWLSVNARPGICGRFVFVHRYVAVESGRGCTHGYLNSLVSVTNNIFLKYDCLESIWLARNVQLRGESIWLARNVQLRCVHLTRC